MTKKYLLVDVDETILHWTPGFIKFIKEHYGIVPNKEKDTHCISTWLECHQDDVYEMVVAFNKSHYFSTLEPYGGAELILPAFYEDDYTIVAITCCSADSVIASLRQRNLRKFFGDIFETIHCLNFNESKKELLESFPPSVWVEDHPDWALTGADFGHHTFIMNHLHNEKLSDKRIKRVYNWFEIYNEISDSGQQTENLLKDFFKTATL